MKFFKKIFLLSCLLLQAKASLALSIRGINQDVIKVDMMKGNLGRYFTTREIDDYNKAWVLKGGLPQVVAAGETNRLTDPGHNRCGDNVLPASQCPTAQQAAWNNGQGCINQTEYNYALNNAIAPLCAQWSPTQFVGWCRCGCFEKSTQVLVRGKADHQVAIAGVGALDKDIFDAYTMTDDSTLYAPIWEARSITATTVGTEEKPLVWVHLENGSSIGLTEEHAVLTAEGVMLTAKELQVGQHQMVTAEGEPVAIKDIQHVATKDPVYNLLTDAGLNHKGHMVVANGVVVGDIMWQNTLAKDLQRVVVRM